MTASSPTPSENKKPGGSARKKLFKWIIATFAVCVVVAVFLVATAAMWLEQYIQTPTELGAQKIVLIEPGTAINTIADMLAKQDVITNPKIFSLWLRFLKPDHMLQAGQYAFEGAVTPYNVFEKLSRGDTIVYQLTIPEGLMTFQILELVTNAPHMTGDVPNNIPEGVLLPETYSYHYNQSRAQLVKQMQAAMQTALDQLWQQRDSDLPIKTKEEALIFASIIEKETGMPDERKRVAAVFVNRLNKRMRLQTDPTVIYAITKGQYVLKRPLYTKDLERQDPYNTYRNYGLPPGPIANPGKASIEAALMPDKTNELYFVADGTGGHRFATNLKQHNQNVRLWRKYNRNQKTLNN